MFDRNLPELVSKQPNASTTTRTFTLRWRAAKSRSTKRWPIILLEEEPGLKHALEFKGYEDSMKLLRIK